MIVCDSYNVQIWLGLRESYSDKVYSIDDVRVICDRFVNEYKDCITITPTEFRYVDGNEPGVIIGFITYPKFIRSNDEILDRAITLGKKLKSVLGQERVSITTPDKTYMLN